MCTKLIRLQDLRTRWSNSNFCDCWIIVGLAHLQGWRRVQPDAERCSGCPEAPHAPGERPPVPEESAQRARHQGPGDGTRDAARTLTLLTGPGSAPSNDR